MKKLLGFFIGILVISVFCIVDDITFKLMNNLNLSNVYFDEIYSLNKAEYEEWKILHAQHKPLIPRL